MAQVGALRTGDAALRVGLLEGRRRRDDLVPDVQRHVLVAAGHVVRGRPRAGRLLTTRPWACMANAGSAFMTYTWSWAITSGEVSLADRSSISGVTLLKIEGAAADSDGRMIMS